MQWGNPHLRPILGVAWDCGGVTTGPVTVPILLSLGVGVMKAQRERRQLQAVLEDAAVKQGEGNTLEGFGIVTLASLLPVLAVEVMAILTGAILPYEYVLEQASLAASRAATEQPAVTDTSPVKEVLFGIRAISPLVVVLILLVVCVLRQPLPNKGFVVDYAEWEESEGEEEEEDAAGHDETSSHKQRWGSSSGDVGSEAELGIDIGSNAAAAAAAKDVEHGAVQVRYSCNSSGITSEYDMCPLLHCSAAAEEYCLCWPALHLYSALSLVRKAFAVPCFFQCVLSCRQLWVTGVAPRTWTCHHLQKKPQQQQQQQQLQQLRLPSLQPQ
ncbi:hypothetical protein COO60DRAFT_335201 [Scenedesmus sp. NREL 46B-D3]|nr:hypothetical protein COO60DRAFT_335201 [Scenedesmus sp. NREL 46B-D3]